ncbi:hypothetical protein NM688_g8944 [Phlebia brevispora]|uniref:Uncharacterized protein n=1 Tax=Phlebia brevispora TaxID=194682 RepID=A0ACC1RL73_9APHY|nr:hypothetical protein NM688_g8944 [Phlebia brevispora]
MYRDQFAQLGIKILSVPIEIPVLPTSYELFASEFQLTGLSKFCLALLYTSAIALADLSVRNMSIAGYIRPRHPAASEDSDLPHEAEGLSLTNVEGKKLPLPTEQRLGPSSAEPRYSGRPLDCYVRSAPHRDAPDRFAWAAWADNFSTTATHGSLSSSSTVRSNFSIWNNEEQNDIPSLYHASSGKLSPKPTALDVVGSPCSVPGNDVSSGGETNADTIRLCSAASSIPASISTQKQSHLFARDLFLGFVLGVIFCSLPSLLPSGVFNMAIHK